MPVGRDALHVSHHGLVLSGICCIVGQTPNFRDQIGCPLPPLTAFYKRGPNRL